MPALTMQENNVLFSFDYEVYANVVEIVHVIVEC